MARRLAIAAILAICLGAPLMEMFDRWDQTLRDGNDTEANAVIAALCVGVAFAVGTIVTVRRIRACSSLARPGSIVSLSTSLAIPPLVLPTPTTSPPGILRI